MIERHDAAVRAAGFGEVWDHVIAQEPNAARGILLGCIAAVGAYAVESGLTVTPQVPDRAPNSAAGPRGRDLTSSGSSPGR